MDNKKMHDPLTKNVAEKAEIKVVKRKRVRYIAKGMVMHEEQKEIFHLLHWQQKLLEEIQDPRTGTGATRMTLLMQIGLCHQELKGKLYEYFDHENQKKK